MWRRIKLWGQNTKGARRGGFMIALGKKWRLLSDRNLGESFDNLALRRASMPMFCHTTAKWIFTEKYSNEYVIGSSKYFQKQSSWCIIFINLFVTWVKLYVSLHPLKPCFHRTQSLIWEYVPLPFSIISNSK